MTAPSPSSVVTTRVPAKYCRGCERNVDVALFPPARQHKDGLHTYCRSCKTRLARRQRKLHTMGRSRFVPTEAARAHVTQLVGAGLTRHQIAEHAGVDRTVLRNLLIGQPHAGQGPGKRLLRDNEARLLAVNVTACVPAPVPPGLSRRAGALVNPTGTIRRLQALMANGWPARELAVRLGCHTPALQIKPDRRCTSSTAAAVRALYDELGDLAGPSSRTATFYRGRGYLPPGWWDDDTIDNPAAVPEGTLTYVVRDGRKVRLDFTAPRAQQVRRLASQGWSPRDIAELLDVRPARVSTDLRRSA